MNSSNSRERLYSLFILLLLIPVGILTKYYMGPGSLWIRNSLGGILYEIFCCLLIFIFRPNLNPAYISLFVFVISGMLELTQLIHYQWLETVRSVGIVRWLIGHTFNPADYIYYAVGCLASFFIMRGLTHQKKST